MSGISGLVRGRSSDIKGAFGGLCYIANQVAYRVANRGKRLLIRLVFFET